VGKPLNAVRIRPLISRRVFEKLFLVITLVLYYSACNQLAVNQINKPKEGIVIASTPEFDAQNWLDSLSITNHDTTALEFVSSLSKIEDSSHYTFKFRVFRKIDTNFNFKIVDWTTATLQQDPTLNVILGSGDFIIELKAELTSNPSTYYTRQIETPLSNTCPSNYVMTPGSSAQNIAPFCVAKYQMSTGAVSSQTANPSHPTRDAAIAACQGLGSQYDLITNMEWQSLAWDVEGIAENWSNFTIGDAGGLSAGIVPGAFYSGSIRADVDSSPCSYSMNTNPCTLNTWSLYKRTHFLSTGEIVWDLGGNDAEYVKGSDTRPHGSNRQIALVTDSTNLSDTKLLYGSFRDFSNTLTSYPYGNLGNGMWNSVTSGIIRGGWWGEAGIYRTNLTWGTSSNAALGYRCVYHP
jgi:hypothetical protein